MASQMISTEIVEQVFNIVLNSVPDMSTKLSIAVVTIIYTGTLLVGHLTKNDRRNRERGTT